jgi:hypothetical protein
VLPPGVLESKRKSDIELLEELSMGESFGVEDALALNCGL